MVAPRAWFSLRVSSPPPASLASLLLPRHSPKLNATHILVLEELRHAKEEGGCLLGAKRLADVEEVDDLGEENAALPRTDGRLVEDPGFLDDGLRDAEREG